VRSEVFVFSAAALATVMLTFLVGLGASGATVAVFVVFGSILVTGIGWSVRRPSDASWLAKWVFLGFMAKIAATLARFYMVTVFYESGDSYRYYRVGVEFASQWRNGNIPGLSGRGSLGTQAIEAFTGGLFAIITPDMLGGFILFAIIAFIGQIMFYAAFRRHAEPHQLKPYAILIFLLPTYAFWPSSIGKDALVVFGLGVSAYFLARSLEAFEVRWLLGLALSLAVIGVIRIHIAALVVAAFVAATLIAKPKTPGPGTGLRRLAVLIAGLGVAAVVLTFFRDIFGVDVLSSQEVDEFAAEIVRRTSGGGSVVSGGPITSPLDLPFAIAHVLFRPFPWEATEIQQFFATAETSFLAIFTLWRLPAIVRNLRQWRSHPYVVFATFYVLGFAAAFTAVRNLGIIARQRGQVVAFFLVFIIGLGWEKATESSRHEVKKLPPLVEQPESPQSSTVPG
jgi:hypothetical protein